MTNALFLYKKRFIAVALIMSYAYLHMRLTGMYFRVPLDSFLQLTTPLPFAQRVLVPAIVHFLSPWLNLPVDDLFFLLELVFTALLFVAMLQLLQLEFDDKSAQILTWLFFLLMPLISVVNYNYTRHNGLCAFYYPYDTSTLFFMTVGYRYCLEARWWPFTLWLVFATVNRETSILLILLIPALHGAPVLRQSVVAWSLLAYAATRCALYGLLHAQQGQWACYLDQSSATLFLSNLHWLFVEDNALLFLYCLACLPLFWFVFLDYIPVRYRAVRYVVLVHVLCLLMMGHFKESRIFGESVVLLYLPVCLGVSRWLQGEEPTCQPHLSTFAYVDRYAVFVVLGGLVLCFAPINALLIRFAHY